MSEQSVESVCQVCPFNEFADSETNYNNEASSDGQSTSCSDEEPETQEHETDVFSGTEFDTYDANEKSIVVSGRTWRCKSTPGEHLPPLPWNASLTGKSESVSTMEECFRLFVSDDIIDIIIRHTNQKARDVCNGTEKIWKPVDRVEIKAFFGLLLIIGRFRESRENKNLLWRKCASYSRSIYAAVMTRDRFKDILQFIRFDDCTTRSERKETDKLAGLREVTDLFTENCRNSYHASHAGTIDEQLVGFRGRCPFKVYMPNKSGKYGIKLRTLCDSKTFYCCNLDVYLGKFKNTISEEEERVVKRLTDFWKNSGRTVTTDNSFTDINLAEDLLKNEIYTVGAIHKNKEDFPKSLINTYRRQQFSTQFLFTNNLTLVSYVPKPGKCIVLLSSLHQEHNICGPKDNYKPEIMSYYNVTKGAVDTLNKLLQEYSCRRCTRRWTLSLFLHYLDIAAYNALVLWLIKNPTWQCNERMHKKREIFLEMLAAELYSENIDRRATAFENGNSILHRHVAKAIEDTGRKLRRCNRICTTTGKRSRCYICIGNDNKYSTKCDNCYRYICGNHVVILKEILCIHCTENE